MFLCILILLLTNIFTSIEVSERQSTSLKARKKTFASVVFSNTKNLLPSDTTSCQWLSRLKHQNKICSKRRGVAKILLDARRLSIAHCRAQFEFDQWNCSKRDVFFRKVYKETAFMYSITASAVMFSVAKACAEGTLSGCSCGHIGKITDSGDWQFRRCSDNTKYAKRFTKKFLQLKKKGDYVNSLIKYNMEVGIKVVLENEERDCRCHGVSTACNMKICTRRIQPFEVIAAKLKTLYYDAVQLQPGNKIRSVKKSKSPGRLLYLESSPNFCPSTVNRHCNNTETCATLCCGRGTYSAQVEETYKCNCRWLKEKLDFHCLQCRRNKTYLKCK